MAHRAVAAFERGCDDPEAMQRVRLGRIVDGLRGTAFAREHGLTGREDPGAFRACVPIRTDAEYAPWLQRAADRELGALTRAPVISLLKTSGTTGPAKLLPVTAAYERAVAEGQALWRLALVRDHEAASRGKVLTVVSPEREGRSEGGIAFGSNTGRMAARQPWFVRGRYAVPPEVHALQDPEARLYATLRFALQEDVRLLVTANPSSVLRLARGMKRHLPDLMADLAAGELRRGPGADACAALPPTVRKRLRRPKAGRIRGVSPLAQAWDLAAVGCWTGGPAPWFLDRFADALGARVPVRDVGVTASEGYFAIPVADGPVGAPLWLGGHVLEFIDADDAPRWAWELEEGQEYGLVITTSAGLYRYDLQDIVQVTGFQGRCPRIRFVRKAGAVLSVTGEKVTEAHVTAAMATALRGTDSEAPLGFSVGHQMAEIPSLRLALESPGPARGAALAARFDAALRQANVEYDAKRDSGRLGPVAPLDLPPGTYDRWQADRQAEGAPAAQIKAPLLLLDEIAWGRLEHAARRPLSGPSTEPAAATGPATAGAARPLGDIEVISWDVDGTLYQMPKVVRGASALAIRRLLTLRAPQEAAELLVLSRFRKAMERARSEEGGALRAGALDGFLVPRPGIIEMERRWYGPPIAAAGPWDGVHDLVDLFDELGLRQIVVSDYESEWKLELLGLAGRFERIYAGERLGALKPNPGLFVHVAKDLGIPPDRILHLGDRPETDGIAATAAGLRVRIFDQGFLTPRGLHDDLRRTMARTAWVTPGATSSAERTAAPPTSADRLG